MALHRIHTDKEQTRVYLFKTVAEAELYSRPALNLWQKFTEYYGFDSKGPTLTRWKLQ